MSSSSIFEGGGEHLFFKFSYCAVERSEFLASKAGQIVGKLSKQPEVAAKPIVADRISFPSPPSFNPAKFLDASTRALYERPIQCGITPEQCSEQPPNVRVFASPDNKVALFKKLAESGRLAPISGTLRRQNFTSGMFSVHKDESRDRLVLDGRPANMLDAKQTMWCKSMASPSALNSIFLKAEHVLLCSGEDLRDFFYQFSVGCERAERNIISDSISLSDARAVFGDGFEWNEDPVTVTLTSLAMGDCLACEFAQGSHIGVLLHHFEGPTATWIAACWGHH